MNITIFSFFVVLFFFVIVIESVRRGILETNESLVWIIICIVLGVLSLSEGLLEYLAGLVGIYYAPSLLFLLGLLATIIMIFDLTRRISKLNHKVVLLTQEYALLKEENRKEIEEVKQQIKQSEHKK